MNNISLTVQLATELRLPEKNIATVVKLLNEGNTVPFIARYRKEETQNLDETQIRAIQEQMTYLLDLEDRRQTIINSIQSQGKLTDDLRLKILQCTSKTTLEDIYLPYKPKRRTRAAIAREKGLEPLALRIMEQPSLGNPEKEAEDFINSENGLSDIQEVLSGARDIVAELVSENVSIRAAIRSIFAAEGIVISKVAKDKISEPTKFEQYYDFKELVSKIPSHRYLAIRRGENEGVLEFKIEIEAEHAFEKMRSLLKINLNSPFANQLEKALIDSYKRLILPSVETDVRVDLKMVSDKAAVEIFSENLRNLLLAPPLGSRSVIGIDPGLRTGCKCVAVDETGKYLDTVTLFLCQGKHALDEACENFIVFINKYKPFAIGVGNGTGGREAETFVRKLLSEAALSETIVMSVSEAGASVYSASDIAREEFPDLDLTIRGAISIARRLQDPLAELVKVDPKAIGVGQYQHDVYQQLLHDKLHEVVESCVNLVGVELNTASASLLSNVAGIGTSLATKIIKHREQKGAFKSRQQLLEVSGLGPRTFEQAAGFLRIHHGQHPLDASAVHPERYEIVEQIAKDLNVPLTTLIGNASLISQIDIKKYFNQTLGELTLKDIIEELKKPGRDPRASFERPCFREDINSIKDLKVGMVLEGMITNVTAFGAFVDVGVHQDGLVHISELAEKYVKDPSEVAQVGNKVKVEVLQVDVERKRISLSTKIGKSQGTAQKAPNQARANQKIQKNKSSFNHNPFAGL